MDTHAHILIVDDEETLCEALRFNLEAEGYAVDTALSAEQALSMDLTRYDIFLLDIMMGDISGVQLARILKSNPSTASTPIIFCTARDSEDDMIAGLDLGADDYIMKPYTIRNVSARVRTVLRRTSSGQSLPASRYTPHTRNHAVTYKGLTVNPANKTCTVDGNEVKLPRKEFEILLKLLSNPGKIYSREQLLTDIWPGETIVLDRVVDVNITRIRQKIGPYAHNLITRSGYGYGFIE